MAAADQHFILYKPDGFLSQFTINEPRGHRKKLLGEFYDFPKEIMPIGRLDEASEGLLILTTNGKLSYYINTSGTAKEYYAQVDGTITQEALTALNKGPEISIRGKKYHTKPCHAKAIAAPTLPQRQKNIRGSHHGPTSWVALTLTEGKYRQVRKMTAVVGFPTLRLVRVRIGLLRLKDLKPGEVRKIQNLNQIETALQEKF